GYSQAWIWPDPQGHLQATGRDARARKQYRYHPRWREVRDATKYERMTTLRNCHVAVSGDQVKFEFRGKGGVMHSVRVNDRRLARIVRQCMDIPGLRSRTARGPRRRGGSR